ncbi:MAG: glycosyltransferase family 39 protein, partial [Armatimonadetes bacterium]|nr:glycosyltransferase family 39 protein [Armatimonadota bacterium]
MAWVSAPSLAPLPIAVAAWAIVSAAAGALGWAVWLAAGGGRALAQRYLCALGLGYALVGYGVLALGLTGHLSPLPMAVLVCGAAVAGIRCIGPLFAVTFAGLGRGAAALRGSRFRVLYGVVLACAAITFLAALGPSDGRDWDGLSEHLAQAKTYLRHHRVEPLWWDHHSHFPAAVVMLYCLGMAFGGQGAAKLFHWGFGVLSLLALWRFSRRHLRTASGGPGAWVLATTPLFGWLATVGYVDLAAVFYSIMACDGVLAWLSERRREDFLQAAVMAGCGMTAKAQGLFTFGVLLIFMGSFVLRQKCRVRELLAFSAIALAIAAPWYIKSWVVTGNPVYPFAYGIFGGKHWSSEQARHYAYHHASFGYGKLPPEDEWQKWPLWKKRLGGPRHPLMMLLAPVTLTLFPEYWEPRHPRLAAALMLSIGPMYLALAPLLLLGGAVGR